VIALLLIQRRTAPARAPEPAAEAIGA